MYVLFDQMLKIRSEVIAIHKNVILFCFFDPPCMKQIFKGNGSIMNL